MVQVMAQMSRCGVGGGGGGDDDVGHHGNMCKHFNWRLL